MIKYIGIAVLCAVATALLRESKSPVHVLLPTAGTVCILVYALGSLGQSVELMSSLADNTAVSEYVETLVRAVGIGYATELTADVCRGCGASEPASAILLFGRAELAAMCCPLLLKLLNSAAALTV